MTDTLNYDEFLNSDITGIDEEKFLKASQQIADVMDLDEEIEYIQGEEQPTVEITYRDSANYKYPFALQLSVTGELLVVEPEWEDDEADEQELFWNILREHFGVASSF